MLVDEPPPTSPKSQEAGFRGGVLLVSEIISMIPKRSLSLVNGYGEQHSIGWRLII